jgi:Ca2+-binding EF-hand superfamily protein
MKDGSLRETFDSMDTDGSGALEVDEVLEVMRKLGGSGKALTRGSVANLVRLADDNSNGSIDYKEFEAIVLRIV